MSSGSCWRSGHGILLSGLDSVCWQQMLQMAVLLSFDDADGDRASLGSFHGRSNRAKVVQAAFRQSLLSAGQHFELLQLLLLR